MKELTARQKEVLDAIRTLSPKTIILLQLGNCALF